MELHNRIVYVRDRSFYNSNMKFHWIFVIGQFFALVAEKSPAWQRDLSV